MMRAKMASLQRDAGESARSRIAWRLLPFLFLLYVANYLDRTNIAYATLGMKGDLGLSDSVFGTASGIFYWIFCAANSRCAAGGTLERQTSPRDNADNLGALTTLTGFVRTPLELYGARFLLAQPRQAFFPV